jgi:hypothetical protein
VGWPLPLTTEQQAKYRNEARFQRLSRPQDLSEADAPEFVPAVETFFNDQISPLHRFAWARGMSEMRQLQTQQVQARIVLGGKTGPTAATADRPAKWYRSRVPGVLEEVLCSLQQQQPVYLVGGFGGCARMVADLLQGIHRPEMSWEYQKGAPHAEAMRQLYASRGLEWWSYKEMTDFLRQQGVAGLRNGLTQEENQELFTTTDDDRIVALLLQGLRQVQ